MFENLELLQTDPILGLMAEFRRDPSKTKIDLGVGVYRNETGDTPIMSSVHEAEQLKIDTEKTKTYIGPAGSEDFNRLTQDLILGKNHTLIKENRISMVQTPGGCGALRVGAEMIKRANPKSTIWVSNPTWANHIPLLGNAGLKIQEHSYYSATNHNLSREHMLDELAKVPADDVVLIHGCCHNPCGVDLKLKDWKAIAELSNSQGFTPFVDLAYQGLGSALDTDAEGLRLLADVVPEMIIASSYSKNFGLYRERVGAVQIVNKNPSLTPVTQAQLGSTVRGIYSMPPAHGAAIVEKILSEPLLFKNWTEELQGMRERINHLRKTLSAELTSKTERDFSFIGEQQGMFSFLGITESQVKELKEKYSIYMVDSSRINIAGINNSNINYFIDSVKAVLRK